MMEQEPLLLSGLQHFAFCRRQWALIHIEQQWADNGRTAEGEVFHRRAHDAVQVELRGDVLTVRGLRIASRRLNVTGACDIVEFHRDPNGITLNGRDGRWRVYPVEYKKGSPKEKDEDRLQLCAQAMCLEEMLVCDIPEGSLYYGEIRRREKIVFTSELRQTVEDMISEMHQYYDRGYTPSVRWTKACNACSLKELCLPVLGKKYSVYKYVQEHMKEGEECGNS